MSTNSPTNVGLIPGIGVSASATGAAGAQVVVTLPATSGRTTYVTSFVVTSGAPAALVTGVVTLANTLGGDMSFQFTETVSAGGWLQANFTWPWPASATNTTLVLTLPAIGGGAVSALTIMGYEL